MDCTIESEGYCGIGDRFHVEQDFKRAALAYSRAILLNKNADHAYTWWSNFLKIEGKYDESIAKGNQVIQFAPKNTRILGVLGVCYEKKGIYDKAEQSYLKAIELMPSSITYRKLGTFYDNMERYLEAEEQYAKAIELDPYSTDAYNNWGCLLHDQMKYEEAISKFKTAIQLDENDVYPYSSCGLTLYQQDNISDMKAIHSKVIELLRVNPMKRQELIKASEEAMFRAQRKLMFTDDEAKISHLHKDIEGLNEFIDILSKYNH